MVLNDYCGVGYDGVCWQFRAAPDLREKILGYIRDTEFSVNEANDPNLDIFKIIDGEGQADYAVYNFRAGNYFRVIKKIKYF